MCMLKKPLANIEPCMHAICRKCFETLLRHDSTTCPFCRGSIQGSLPSLVEYRSSPTHRCLRFEREDSSNRLGATLSTRDGRVYISDVIDQSVAQHIGFETGQELLSINGLPCTNVKMVQTVLKNAQQASIWVRKKGWLGFYGIRRKSACANSKIASFLRRLF